MLSKVEKAIEEVKAEAITNLAKAEEFRIKYLGSKGLIKALFSDFKDVAKEEKKAFGQRLNELKQLAEERHAAAKGNLENTESAVQNLSLDLTMPGVPATIGARHPLSVVKARIADIFNNIGFNSEEGPEIEDDWHNFTALNFPPEHPARDMQDTFFVKGDHLLRTHTSSVQVRLMQSQKPPLRFILPGRVYRNEAVSARSHCFFHQLEGIYIDKNVSFADLKQTLLYFAREFFGEKTKIRLRPSYFPFTEPSAEMDVSCSICNQKGCNVCKYTGWLEVLGCGMIHPNVLENCGIDSKEYSGFAFGMGIERLAMRLYAINDLRLFSENDVRFLEQFKAETA